MKLRISLFLFAFGLCSVIPLSAQDPNQNKGEEKVTKKNEPLPIDDYLLRADLYDTSIEDMLKEGKDLGFEYMSRQKTSLRSEESKLTLFGLDVGEVIIRSEDGIINSFKVAIFNKGDDGKITQDQLNQIFDHFEQALSEKTSERPRDKDRGGVSDIKGRLWVTDDQAFLLESAVNEEGDPEFIRLLGKSARASRARKRMSTRSALKQNVSKKDNDDVYIEGIPMVDQGEKGYCAVATAQRIFNYYGNGIDMHELAQAAGTKADSGTSLDEMVSSLKKAMSLVRSRILITWEKYDGYAEDESDYQSYMRYLRKRGRLCKKYNRARKKKGFSDLMIPIEEYDGVDAPAADLPSNSAADISSDTVDLELWREINMDSNDYRIFIQRIKKYIDQGIPVAWTLKLGLFKEQGLPQTGGGHMRLIIGYNEKTNEIIYSDSWGKGHDYKRMHSGNAFCMSTSTMVFLPNR